MAGVWIAVYHSSAPAQRQVPAPTFAMTSFDAMTDDLGRFNFRNLPAGNWTISAARLRDGVKYKSQITASTGAASLVMKLEAEDK